MGRTKGSKNKINKDLKQIIKKGKESTAKILEKINPVEESIDIKETEIINGIPDNKQPLTKEQTERQEKLRVTLRDINKNIEGAKIDFADKVEVKERQSFGYKCLDMLTGGGILRGNCSVIWGSKGCGKTTIALKMIGTAQKEGKIVAYIDVERTYDPIWASLYGVDDSQLVHEVCTTAEAVMDTVIRLCKEKVVDLIVIDSIQGLSPHGEQYEGKADKERSVQDDTMALLARKLSQFFRMATPHIADAKCAVLLIGQARMDLGSFIKLETLSGGHALMHYSRLILRIRRGQGADAPTEKRPTGEKDKNGKEKMKDVAIGFDAVIHVNKSQMQGCTEGDDIHVPFYFAEGIKE